MDRIHADRRHVKAQILMRLADFNYNAARLGQRPASLYCRIGSFHCLHSDHNLILDYDGLTDPEFADFFGHAETKLDIIPFFRPRRTLGENPMTGNDMRQAKRRFDNLDALGGEPSAMPRNSASSSGFSSRPETRATQIGTEVAE
jgi:hypothetical protein